MRAVSRETKRERSSSSHSSEATKLSASAVVVRVAGPAHRGEVPGSGAGADRVHLLELADSLLVPLMLVDIDAAREAGVDADSLAVLVVTTAQKWRAWGASEPLRQLEEIAELLAPVAEGSHVHAAIDDTGSGVATGRYGFCTHDQSCGWSIEVVGNDGAVRWACLRTLMIRSD